MHIIPPSQHPPAPAPGIIFAEDFDDRSRPVAGSSADEVASLVTPPPDPPATAAPPPCQPPGFSEDEVRREAHEAGQRAAFASAEMRRQEAATRALDSLAALAPAIHAQQTEAIAAAVCQASRMLTAALLALLPGRAEQHDPVKLAEILHDYLRDSTTPPPARLRLHPDAHAAAGDALAALPPGLISLTTDPAMQPDAAELSPAAPAPAADAGIATATITRMLDTDAMPKEADNAR